VVGRTRKRPSSHRLALTQFCNKYGCSAPSLLLDFHTTPSLPFVTITIHPRTTPRPEKEHHRPNSTIRSRSDVTATLNTRHYISHSLYSDSNEQIPSSNLQSLSTQSLCLSASSFRAQPLGRLSRLAARSLLFRVTLETRR
jgi:hypothetical protein